MAENMLILMNDPYNFRLLVMGKRLMVLES